MRRFFRFILPAALVLGGLAFWMIQRSRAAEGRRQLDELVQTLKAKGEAVLPEDFPSKVVAAEDDAAPGILQAISRENLSSKQWKDVDSTHETHLPATAEEAKIYRALIESESEALKLLDAALAKKDADWRVHIASPAIAVMLPHLNKLRGASNLLRVAALDACARGDYRAALERVRQILKLSRLCDGEPFVVAHMVSVGIGSDALDLIYQMTPELRIETAGKTDAKAASAQQMREIIAELLDERGLREGMTIALKGERMVELDTVRLLASGKLKWKDLVPATAPAAQGNFDVALADAKLMAEQMDAMISAAASADYPAYKNSPFQTVAKSVEQGDHPYAKLLLPSLDGVAKIQFRALTERRLAATALALRWAAEDGGGKLPASLEELKPKYLAKIPLDPMLTERPLSYKPDGATPKVYSFGEDGVDNGGSEKRVQRIQGRWALEDVVVRVGR